MRVLAAIGVYLGIFFLLVSLLFKATMFPDEGHINLALWIGFLILGIIGILLSLVLRWRNVKQALTSKSTALGFNMAVVIVVVIGILVFANLIAQQRNFRVDMDEYGRNSLTKETRDFVKNLDEPILIEYFFSPQGLDERNRVETLFENFKYVNEDITYKFINIDENPMVTQQRGVTQTPMVIVSLAEGDRSEQVEAADEELLANAMVKLTRTNMPTVYFTVGHGELTPDQEPGATLRTVIEQDGYSVESITLSQYEEIPDATGILVSLLPRGQFLDRELETLEKFLNNGGRYLLAMQPSFEGEERNPGLVRLLADYGVEADNAVVIEPRQDQLMAMLTGATALSPALQINTQHPVTRKLEAAGVFQLQVNNARALKRMDSVPPEVEVTLLAQGSDDSWGETDFEMIADNQALFDQGVDMPGPVGAAAAAVKSGDSDSPETRIIVMGDLQSFINRARAFFFNSINWLGDQGDLITVDRQTGEFSPLALDYNDTVFIFGVTLFAIPLLSIVIGIIVVVVRRTKAS